MLESSRSLPDAPLSFSDAAARLLAWLRREPVAALLLVASVGVILYFFGFYRIFLNGTKSTRALGLGGVEPGEQSGAFRRWCCRSRSSSSGCTATNSPPRARSRGTPGCWIVALGVICFVLGARSLQPRIAIFSLPVIVLGVVAFLWGRQVARIVLFPCAFLLFMIPIGGLVQGTVSLQILVSTVCNALASFVGMKIEASGTTIRSLDGSFNFEIAEGCSGIRSLMAMTTLTALYVHFTQREWWKKGVIFAGSLVFAVVGNIGRIFTVILVAKFVSPKIAGGIYHDYSGFIFFPIAVLAMVGFASLVNLDWPAILPAYAAASPEPAIEAVGPAVKRGRSQDSEPRFV